ncbi:hypothetical protein TNCV_1999061 [Trichonephila clavipes]|nr:hypothetical protein TNCV_1998971 [Trichonephila clavipes]GFT81247.1 hypothetical protein TNCV_1999061 [Trichonephila clavipes]
MNVTSGSRYHLFPSAAFFTRIYLHPESTDWSDWVYFLGSPVVKVKDSCPACYEFEPSTVEDPPCRGERCTLNLSTAQTSSRLCGVVVERTSSGVVHVT